MNINSKPYVPPNHVAQIASNMMGYPSPPMNQSMMPSANGYYNYYNAAPQYSSYIMGPMM